MVVYDEKDKKNIIDIKHSICITLLLLFFRNFLFYL